MTRRRRRTRVAPPSSETQTRIPARERVAPAPVQRAHVRRTALAFAGILLLAGACLGVRGLRTPTALAEPAAPAPAPAPAPPAVVDSSASAREADALAYAGRDAHRRPRYVRRAFTDEERALLRDAFGIADPNRLWLPDSTPAAVLRYDGAGGLAARVGYRSWRRHGETWEAFVARIRALDRRAWPGAARSSYHTGLAWLDADARVAFAELLDAARAAGFTVRVAETYRAPERQAYLLAHGNGQTFTATSAHQYGRAADILVGDGRIDTMRKVREWIRFRRWVLAWGEGRFRLVGTPSDTFDWPHVELADPPVGFRSVDELLDAARTCLTTPPRDADDDPCALPRDDGARATLRARVAHARHTDTLATPVTLANARHGDVRSVSPVSR
ncbi:peptidase M15B and M15C DD-carboxypeptidase VanY/endolysin (plasmid) [Gemmatirosa kalamazoonensis]|uniref:Peptidase M15B and M15C DD-carboxypeptidase VanY/endolysin n=1 Tax=Gemmatirosa kalamazoonensis TaxID=861299 RepID=W0RSD5_9BACT|nr:peptidase M15B and M15C DD-carboxypeptidase VanY/endolysin [Gemmatirosa kalamazoonensis]